MPSQDDWFLREHYVEPEIEYLPEEVPEPWRLVPIFGRAKNMPELTPAEELVEMNKQVEISEGFDIDFKMFDCLFNYRPVDLDEIDYAEKRPTMVRTVLNRLSRKRLGVYNKENGTSFEFLKVVKANYFMCVGMMYFITFEVLDPFDYQPKLFQAKINYFYRFNATCYLCRPKPDHQKVACTEKKKKRKKKTVKVDTSPPLLKTQADYTSKDDEAELSLTKPLTTVATSNPTRKAHEPAHGKISDGQTQINPVTASVLLLNHFNVLSDIAH